MDATEQSRPRPWKPGAGGEPFAHLPFRGPTPECRPCHWRERDRRLGFWCHQESRPRPTRCPFSARGVSLGLASGSRAAIEKRRPNGLLNGFMSPFGQFPKLCHWPPSSTRPSRAPRRRQSPRTCDGTAGWGSFLRPTSFVEARQLGEVSHRQKHRCRAMAIVTDTETAEEGCRRRRTMIIERRAFVEVFIHGGPRPWVDDLDALAPKSGATGAVRSGYC
jgi:hypothetical protein